MNEKAMRPDAEMLNCELTAWANISTGPSDLHSALVPWQF